MSQITKRALEQSLKNLLLKKPLTKITINDIAEDCGINRMTFYIHRKAYMKEAMKMAWITEQALADYLNWYPNRNENEELLRSLLAEDVTFTMGTRCYRGIDAVMNEFSNMSDAISSDHGFVARPVIAKEMLSDNPDQFIRRKAIALCSKLEEYISWLFFITPAATCWGQSKQNSIPSLIFSGYPLPSNTILLI